MANPHPTPKPENLRPPWPTGTSGNPAGYSRGRPLPSRHMSGRLTRSQKKSPTKKNTDQKRRSDLCFGRLIRTICCPAARHMSGSSGAQDDRWFVGDPLGLTPPGYELAPHTGLDKAPPRTRDEGRLDARATSHWSWIATQQRSCLPGAVTSA